MDRLEAYLDEKYDQLECRKRAASDEPKDTSDSPPMRPQVPRADGDRYHTQYITEIEYFFDPNLRIMVHLPRKHSVS